MKVGVIVNLAAGGGRMRRLWPEIHRRLCSRFDNVQFAQTSAGDDAAALAAGLAHQGFALIVAAGGDGTIGAVADGLLSRGGAALPALGVLPFGTGSDFAGGLNMPAGVEAAVERLATGSERTVDVGLATYTAFDGRQARRHFINVASLGLSGPIAGAVNAARQRFGGSAKALFYWHTVRELLRYRPCRVRMRIDDGPAEEMEIALVAVANGRFFGGGMMIAPDASYDDGLLDVVVVRAAGKARLIADLRQLYSGAHRNNPLCSFARGRRVVVEATEGCEPALLDVDGEAPGRIAATFEVLPDALRLRC